VAGPLGRLGQAGRGQDLAPELGRTADVDQRQAALSKPGQDVVAEGAELEVGLVGRPRAVQSFQPPSRILALRWP
jgi:hypothetical protein